MRRVASLLRRLNTARVGHSPAFTRGDSGVVYFQLLATHTPTTAKVFPLTRMTPKTTGLPCSTPSLPPSLLNPALPPSYSLASHVLHASKFYMHSFRSAFDNCHGARLNSCYFPVGFGFCLKSLNFYMLHSFQVSVNLLVNA